MHNGQLVVVFDYQVAAGHKYQVGRGLAIQAVDLCLVKCARSPLVGSDIALTIKSRILLSLNSSSW